MLTAMMPLGLAACYGVPQTRGAADAGSAPTDPTKGEAVEVDSAGPDPSGHDPAAPDESDPDPAQDSAPPVDVGPATTRSPTGHGHACA